MIMYDDSSDNPRHTYAHFALIRYVLLVGYVFHFDSLLEVPQLL